jgi:hypothetical protein
MPSRTSRTIVRTQLLDRPGRGPPPQYNAGVEPQQSARRIFSLDEARGLLPEVKALTADAVRRVERLSADLEGVPETDSSRAAVEAKIASAVREWANAIEAMGLAAKGLWLVDFDNGEGYYCWCHPEKTVSHFHDYDGGFRGRMKIV